MSLITQPLSGTTSFFFAVNYIAINSLTNGVPFSIIPYFFGPSSDFFEKNTNDIEFIGDGKFRFSFYSKIEFSVVNTPNFAELEISFNSTKYMVNKNDEPGNSNGGSSTNMTSASFGSYVGSTSPALALVSGGSQRVGFQTYTSPILNYSNGQQLTGTFRPGRSAASSLFLDGAFVLEIIK